MGALGIVIMAFSGGVIINNNVGIQEEQDIQVVGPFPTFFNPE